MSARLILVPLKFIDHRRTIMSYNLAPRAPQDTIIQPRTLNFGGQLLDLSIPIVMGIANLTPDSFYAKSRVQALDDLGHRAQAIFDEGGSIIDLGAYSTRPGAEDVPEEIERQRLEPALRLLRDAFPSLPISVDTFRGSIARWAVKEHGVGMINDISGGQIDPSMFDSVADLGVPYILMHMRGTPATMAQYTDYTDLAVDILDYLAERVTQLREHGVHDVIIDPGFGFSKTLEQNYELMTALPRLKATLRLPILVGISRKSMIYKALGTSPEESLNGTTILNTYSLLGGADILRVHDVRAAAECITLLERLRASERPESSTIEHWVRSPYPSTTR